MFDKLLNKGAAPVAAAGAQRAGAPATPGIPESELQAWRERIAAAKGDDQALLQLAREAPETDLKLAALAALTHEDALKQATREFRDQDKRLYRAAKARWETAVARRQAFEEAPALIATAKGLLEQQSVPANRLVELDRAWSALNVAAFDEALESEFAAARAQLGAKLREHGEGEQALARWLAATETAMGALTAGLADLARGVAVATHSAATTGRATTLLQLLNEAPAAAKSGDERGAGRIDAANRALALASSVVQRAEFLQSLPVAGAADEADEKAKIEQWRAFPEVSDGTLQAVLTHRFTEWHNASSHERDLERDARRTREGEESAQQRKKHLAGLQHQVEAAEAAHAAGQVAELTRLMAAIDAELKASPPNSALGRRIDSLRQEQQRLRDWQRWSGGQRREQAVAEAQALAKAAGEEKLALKAHADAIAKLRERWKELDKLGGATNKTLWLAFDGALKSAYAPIAAHLEKLKSARSDNLVARDAIIEGLAGVRSKFDPAAADWRALARAIEDAKIAWRKLGPVEHTVPREAQKGEKSVEARFTAALRALEEPLAQAYRDAGAERERLIAAARELGASTPPARDSIDKVRTLQTMWQAHAKSLPLPRREENALWTAFKAATDAVFTARDAARAAREAEANAPIKAREAIIDTLLAMPAETAGQIKRAIADADTAWRASPRVHGPQASRIEARYREARDTASKRLRAIAERAALARYHALLAAMRICDEREAGADSPDLESRWNALTDLPAAWKTAMDARFKGTAPAKRPPLPDTLLSLEAACDIESPAEFAAARRQLKMNALKFAMENRRPDAGASPADIERWLLEAASTPSADAASRARLEKIIAAIQSRPSRTT